MHPVLGFIWGIEIRSYGLMLGLAFFFGTLLAYFWARREGYSFNQVVDLAILTIIGALVGSRILYVILEWDYYRYNLSEIIALHRGGLVFIGGLFGTVLLVSIYLWYNHLPYWKTADLLMPSLGLGQALGRIGCFLNGCCYGQKYAGFMAVTFQGPGGDFPRFPIQLVESAFGLMMLLITSWWLGKRGPDYSGQVFLLYIGCYSFYRFMAEFFRGDDRGGLFFNLLSVSQLLSVLMVLIVLVIWSFRSTGKPQKNNQTSVLE